MAHSQEVSLTSRVKIWFESLPLFTRTVFIFLAAIYTVQLITGFDAFSHVCLSPNHTIYNLQAYRLVTAMLFHVGLLHVAFNLMAFAPMGNSLERTLGTLQFGYLVLLFGLLEGALYIFLCCLLTITRLSPSALHQCAIGFSGIIFGLIVVDNAATHTPQRSIFGLFTVPSAVYPWVLLVFWQLMMPGVSFLGHLSGVLVGQAYVCGYLKFLQLPRGALLAFEDTEFAMRYLTRFPSFMMVPGPTLPVSTSPGSSLLGGGGSGATVMWRGAQGVMGSIAQLFRGRGGQQPQGYTAVRADEEGGALHNGIAGGGGGEKKFDGTGYQLGGTSSSHNQQNAQAAAAAAAEARMAAPSAKGSSSS